MGGKKSMILSETKCSKESFNTICHFPDYIECSIKFIKNKYREFKTISKLIIVIKKIYCVTISQTFERTDLPAGPSTVRITVQAPARLY